MSSELNTPRLGRVEHRIQGGSDNEWLWLRIPPIGLLPISPHICEFEVGTLPAIYKVANVG
jgi:hypothetical protein